MRPEVGDLWEFVLGGKPQYVIRLIQHNLTTNIWLVAVAKLYYSNWDNDCSFVYELHDRLSIGGEAFYDGYPMWRRYVPRACLCGTELPDDDSYACPDCVEMMLNA